MSSGFATVLKPDAYELRGERLICARRGPGPGSPPPAADAGNQPDAGPPGTGKPGAEAASGQAEAIISRAELRAAEILAQAGRDAADAARQAASAAEAGALLRTQEEAAAKLAAAEREAGEIVATARAEREVILAAAQRELLVLALEVARRVVAQELRISPDIVLAVAGEALAHLPTDARAAQLRVNPNDRELVEEHRERLLAAASALDDLTVKADRSVSPGGCVVSTEMGDVDAGLKTRIDRLGAALLGNQEGEQQR